MLVPLTREKLEQLIPVSATAEQYRYYSGKFPDFLRRLLISVVSVVVVWVLELAIKVYVFLALPIGIAAGLYWLWAPVLWAGLRNAKYRKIAYAGFWRGEIWDVFITEELVNTEETVNDRGELVIVENRERRINLELGDDQGFSTVVQAPLQREHQRIAVGQTAELLLLSNQPDLERIAQITDVYIPQFKTWVSDYPFVKRDVFESVSRQLQPKAGQSRRSARSGYEEYYDDDPDELLAESPPQRSRQGSPLQRRPAARDDRQYSPYARDGYDRGEYARDDEYDDNNLDDRYDDRYQDEYDDGDLDRDPDGPRGARSTPRRRPPNPTRPPMTTRYRDDRDDSVDDLPPRRPPRSNNRPEPSKRPSKRPRP